MEVHVIISLNEGNYWYSVSSKIMEECYLFFLFFKSLNGNMEYVDDDN